MPSALPVRCHVCGAAEAETARFPVAGPLPLCQVCLEMRALVRCYIEQAHKVTAASLTRLYRAARAD